MSVRCFTSIVSALLLAVAPVVHAAVPGEALPQELVDYLNSLDPKQGDIALPQANATLNLGANYDFYSRSDAVGILVDLWGNPPVQDDSLLGLILPAGVSPISETWGAVISFEDIGYVSDYDAAVVDFDELMEQLQEAGEASNEEREAAGYPAVHVIGWAERPKYDAETHSVIWARDVEFEDATEHTLNYDLRTLGRRGVLSVNFVSPLAELDDIRVAASDFASHASFDVGSRYEDFDPSVDAEAGYGIGGLVAGGVGLAAAKKFGLLAILAKFGKFIVLGAIALFGALWRPIARVLGLSKPEEEYYYEEAEAPIVSAEDEEPAGPDANDADRLGS